MNDMREVIWKGLLTHDSKKGANINTYLDVLIERRFNTLLDRTIKKKYSMLDHYADVWSTTGIDRELLETDETPESVFSIRETMMQEHYSLTQFERQVYGDLIYGRSLEEMEKRHRATRVKVISAINRIDRLIRARSN